MPSSLRELHFILWDFEGTLAVRPGRYAGALAAAAAAKDPAFHDASALIRPHLSGAFPWHGEKLSHPYGHDPDAWWHPVLSSAQKALMALGMEERLARKAAVESRNIYLDPAGWRLYPRTLETLEILSAHGWHHAILSNFAPELDGIVSGLGLADYFDQVFASGRTGYEKPSKACFAHAIASLAPGRVRWMVGDNPVADVAGGQEAGLKTILIGPDKPLSGGPSSGGWVSQLGEVPSVIIETPIAPCVSSEAQRSL